MFPAMTLGSPSACALPKGWLTVKDALRLPEPDTSWMDKPMSRANFTAWLQSQGT